MDREDILSTFTDEEKAKAFDRIATHYYSGNFGSFSKSDLETLVFTVLLDHLHQENSKTDDYTLSKILGITQSRVRSLKQKSQLQYPSNLSWEESFISYLKNARYDDTKKLVKVSIPEINVLIELRYFIESHGWLDEYQLNPKLFQCPLDHFILLCNELKGGCSELDNDTKEKVSALEKTLKNEDEKNGLRAIIAGDTKDGLHKFIQVATKKGICELLKLIPCVSTAKLAIDFIIAVLEK